ncbi:MAG: pentapeptide repeat-containing protein [Cyanobacteria bacterium P01_A01_bin.80]
MKASEVLNRYAVGERDFRRVSLRGQSFKGQDLSGADFSEANIRSADFSGAILKGSKFCGAKAGLQKHWMIFLLVASLLLLVFLGLMLGVNAYFILYFFLPTADYNIIIGLFVLLAHTIFFVVIIRKGINAALGILVATIVTTGSIAVTGIGALTVSVATAIGIAGVFANATATIFAFIGILADYAVLAAFITISFTFVVIFIFTGTVSKTFVLAFLLGLPNVETFTGTDSIAIALTIFISAIILFVNSQVARQVIAGDEKYALLRRFVIAIAATKGTSFRGADLTDTDFTGAMLKSTDLRKANLTHTCWRNTQYLDRVRPGNSYLHSATIRELVVTGNGQSKQFDHLFNLRGINLNGANLADANFHGSSLKDATLQGANLTDANLVVTNLNRANLRDSNLSRAKLVQAQIDRTDLAGANLTGAYIEDWGITTETNLEGVKCDYVFMRLPPPESSDPNPHRKPDNWDKNFAPGEFIDFITPMVQTLDLYHNRIDDPRLIAIAFKQLCDNNLDAKLEIISMERRGKTKDGILIRVETSPQANNSQLHTEYFDTYDNLQALPPEALQALLRERQSTIRLLAGILETKHNSTEVSINNSQNQGDINMSGDRNINTGGGNYNENIAGNYIQGNYYAAAEKQNLTEAAAEIQALLEQLEKSYPTDTTTGKMALATEAIAQIENNPNLTARILSALKVGSVKAFEQFLNHPAASFVIGALEDWEKTKGN